jgi:hypothetical protein
MLKVLYDPDSFFKNLEIHFVIPFAIVLISGLLGSLAVYLKMGEFESYLLQTIPNENPELTKALVQFVELTALVSPFIGAIFQWVILSGVLYGLSALLGGSGDFSKTLKFTAFCYVPSIILFPISFYLADFDFQRSQVFALTPSLILSIAIGLWQAFILVFALKHARDLSVKKSLICVAITFGSILLLSILTIFLIPTGVVT